MTDLASLVNGGPPEAGASPSGAPTPRKVTSIGPRGRTEHTIDG
jgi:hypothetical protein